MIPRKTRSRIALCFLIGLAPLLASSCGSRPQTSGRPPTSSDSWPKPEHPNVLLIEICSLRYDHLSCAGYDRPTSPTIDALAERGVLFRRCISAASWTKPSTASILTGLTPSVHALTDGAKPKEIRAEGYIPQRVLQPGVVTLAEALQRAGYQTAGFVSNVNAWPVFGVDQGFDYYNYEEPNDGPALLSRFLEWLDHREQDKPFFAFLLFIDVHNRYTPPYEYYVQFCRDPSPVKSTKYKQHWREVNRLFIPRPKDWSQITDHRIRQILDLYDGEIRYLDDTLADLFEALESQSLDETTAIVLVSDHGEQFTEHGLVSHGNSLYNELLHVPLILSFPGCERGRLVDDLVSSLDIYPTVLEYCGVADVPHVQGRSILGYVDAEIPPPPATYAFSSMGRPFSCVQDKEWKLAVRRRGTQLFRLEEGENEDFAGEHPEIVRRLEQVYEHVLEEEEALRAVIGKSERQDLDPEAIRQLKSLGYL
jgi:arylsulfatase A-like enzyme